MKINKYLSLFLIMALLFLSIGLYAQDLHSVSTPQEKWDALAADVDSWVDGAGYRVDKEIKETIIALNLMGVETTASCEGHLDRGLAYPWVDIQIYPTDVQKLMREFSLIEEQRKQEEESLREKSPQLSYHKLLTNPETENFIKLNEKYKECVQAIKERQMQCLEPLKILLNQFYDHHKSSYDTMLIISFNQPFACLCSLGADRQIIRSKEEKSLKLKEYQKEMKAFTAFLKQKFMDLK